MADDLFLDLGGAAEDRLDAAEPPELTIALEQRTRACIKLGRPRGLGRLLDVTADDVDAAGAAVLKLGATSLSSDGVNWRVYADPAGKPFCLCWD